MDYEKKYKEALERAKKLHKDAITLQLEQDIKDYEHIFPELKESEDEKIRKELLAVINDLVLPEEQQSRFVAWLEKQGESIKIKKGKNYLCTKTHKYAGVEWIEGVKYYSPEDYSLVNQGCTCYCPKYSKEKHNNFFKEVEYDGCLEKQGEQKPFDYENANIQQNDFASIEPDDLIEESYQQQADDIIDMVTEKPAWSEEDEKMLDDILMCGEHHCYLDAGNIAWLKSLRDRVQLQNTITDEELSQAKKEAYNDALNKIEYHSGEPTFDDGWDAAMWYLKNIEYVRAIRVT